MGHVAILEHPKSSYIVRSQPVTLSCKALNAQRIQFKCNSEWLDDKRHIVDSGIDPITSQSYLLVQVEINRQEVENKGVFIDFDCRCYATAGSLTEAVRSEVASIRIAYIRKHFYQMPSSERVPEGQTVQLTCTPPDADPKVEVAWTKDSIPIRPNVDSNLIIANDGNLIISAARLTDSGNYTCIAENLANKRVSDTANVVVYVDGEWSPWSPYEGSCKINCALLYNQLDMVKGDEVAVDRAIPKQRRTRTCNNPAPLNGGTPCKGLDEDFRVCEHNCIINGAWSHWTPWSECTHSCTRTRSRACVAPPRANGGTKCFGTDFETINCTNMPNIPAHCMQNQPEVADYVTIIDANRSTSSSATTNIVPTANLINGLQNPLLFIAFGCVIFLLLVVVALIFLLFCRRRSMKGTSSFYSDQHARAVLLTPEQKALLTDAITYDAKYPAVEHYVLSNGQIHAATLNHSHTLCSGKSCNSSAYSIGRKTTGSRVALIADYSSATASVGSNAEAFPKMALVRRNSHSSVDENYATLYDYVHHDNYLNFEEKSVSSNNDQSATIVATQVDKECSKIDLRRTGVMLTISESTFSDKRMVFLAVSDDLDERPHLPPDETGLSSIIMFGLCETEQEITLSRPVIITFEHCASMFPKDNWTYILYADWGYGQGWEVAARLGEENINTQVYVHLERERCHIMTENFGRFFLAGCARKSNVAAQKRVRLAAFASVNNDSQNLHNSTMTVRVYCVPEIGMAIENVRKQEESDNGVLLAQTSNFLMQQHGSLCVCIENLADGFVTAFQNNFLEIYDHKHQWCAQNGLHCSLTIEGTSTTSMEYLHGRMVIYQLGSSCDKQILELTVQKSDKLFSHTNLYESNNKIVSNSFQLSSDVKRQLVSLFRPSVNAETDWRDLAKKLGFERFIQYFGTRLGCQPASLIFDLWETVVLGSERAVLDLLQTLRVMGRPDAVEVIEHFLSDTQYSQMFDV